MPRSVDDILEPKPDARPRIYAYAIDDAAHEGLFKIGQTMRDVRTRVAEQLRTAGIANYRIELEEHAERPDGSIITDHEVRRALVAKGMENPFGEWVCCGLADVHTVLGELRTGQRRSGTHHLDFPMRDEQAEAVAQTHAYFASRWAEDEHAVPRFLWNAKMRFGKTFTTYQLARKMGAKRVLVLTFKPAVEDAWQTDLENHVDFDGWQYLSRNSGADPTQIDADKPVVYFGSFQDMLGRDKLGNIKARNEWLHAVNWDVVVFDEHHFGAWRETAKELFESEEEALEREEKLLEDTSKLNERVAELRQPLEPETEFLPITTKAYLYLSGTPFKALATGEFIEEQIFNWTYTDEQRAKEEFAARNPGQWNPYGSLPQMRLLTYQMPDELLAIASAGEFDEFDLNEFFAATGMGDAAEFKHKDEVQTWLNIIRGQHAVHSVDHLRTGSRPPFPYSDVRLLPYLQHSFWFLPNVAACHAMKRLLAERQNTFWHEYKVVVAAGASAGIGLDALPPVRAAIGSGYDTKSITLSCGKLTTGVTVKQWSSILMLRNLKSPETYFQAAFRVQSPWAIRNPNGDNPHEEEVLKPVCFVFDFAPMGQPIGFGVYDTHVAKMRKGDISPEQALRGGQLICGLNATRLQINNALRAAAGLDRRSEASVKLKLDIDPDIVAMMAAEVAAGERAVSAAIREAAIGLKVAWRLQITGAGLGPRLARTIRSEQFPKATPSLNAAAVVWSNAPVIVGAHDTGPLIRSKNGFWLAIPTPAAGKSLRGGRITPAEWELRTGLRLRFVYRRTGPSLLVAEGRLNTKGRAVASKSKTGRGVVTAPIFFLVPQVKLPKRLDLARDADRALDSVPGLIVANWVEEKI